jgi:hypothetical protein
LIKYCLPRGNWFCYIVKFYHFSNENDTDLISELNQKVENPMEFNEKKRKKLGSAIQESFLHQKSFKIEKMTLPKKTEPNKQFKQKGGSTETKAPKHRFNVV